jgi:hypothetical protein
MAMQVWESNRGCFAAIPKVENGCSECGRPPEDYAILDKWSPLLGWLGYYKATRLKVYQMWGAITIAPAA